MSNLKSSDLLAGTECPVEGIYSPENPDECEFRPVSPLASCAHLTALGRDNNVKL
jgi:hypothetical protein